MARPLLFDVSQSSHQTNQFLVQFKAGKMVKNGNLVSPVKDKKGLVYLHQSQEDTLMHFCWKDRTSGQVEDDLIIFPDDAEFLKVPQCTTGRVFVLKFKTSPRRLFFWSQEAKDDKDDEYVFKINEYINNPTAARNASSAHNIISPSDLSMNAEDELRNLFSGNDMSAQLMSMLSSARGLSGNSSNLVSLLGNAVSGSSSRSSSSSNVSTPPAPQTPTTTPALASSNPTSESSSTTGGSNSPAGHLRLADLQTIISGISSGQNADNDVSVDLSSTINLEVLRPLLSNEDFMQQIREMLPNTTTSNSTTASQVADTFTSTIQSPQFQQALSSFCAALQSGQLGPLIQQFGLPEECVNAANSGNLEAFVRGLQKQSDDKGKKDEPPKDKKGDKSDDESMSVD